MSLKLWFEFLDRGSLRYDGVGGDDVARFVARERASRESLRKQLEALRIELAELRRDNKLLRDQLARRLGEERTTGDMGTTQNPNNDKPFLTTAPDFAGSVRLA